MSGKNSSGLRLTHQAFVLGLFDTGLAVIRSLGKYGIPVVGLDHDPKMPGFKSRYCTARLSPDPVHQPDETLEFLLNAGKQLADPGILFPATDAFVLFVSRHRDALKEHFRFNLPSGDIVESIADKRKQYELAEKSGVLCPRAFFPESANNTESFKNLIDYPAIVKGCYSHQWQENYPGIKGFKVHDPGELAARIKELLPAGIRIMVQSIIPGVNTNHYKVCAYINQEGKTLALFALQKIRQYPVEFGVGTCVMSIRSDELVKVGVRFFDSLKYRGVGSIEFKKDDRDNAFKLIELNPRYWQQNDHARACGIDFPLIQYADLTGQKPAPQLHYRTGVKWLDPMSDFQSFLDHRRDGQLSFGKWLSSLRGTRAFSAWSLSDPGPMLKSIEYGWKIVKAPLYMLKTN
jgi:D-aspartate ligase